MQPRDSRQYSTRGGFTLVEMMMATSVLVAVVISTLSLFLNLQGSWHTYSLTSQSAQDASVALERIMYGIDTNGGMRSVASTDVALVQSNGAQGQTNGAWRLYLDGAAQARYLEYLPQAGRIVNQNGDALCEHLTSATVSLSSGGCEFALRVGQSRGRRSGHSSMRTYVQFRN